MLRADNRLFLSFSRQSTQSYFRSTATVPVLYGICTHSVKALKQVQTFACKMVSRRWDAAYEELLELVNIPSLQERRIHLKLGLLYKIIHGLCYFPDEVFTFRPSLVPGAEEECLVHTDALPVN